MQGESRNLKSKKRLLVVIYARNLWKVTPCALCGSTFFQSSQTIFFWRLVTSDNDSFMYFCSYSSLFSDLPCCLPAGFATHGGVPQLGPAPRSSPILAGIVSGRRCSSGSSGLGDEGATPWSSPSGSSQFYEECVRSVWVGECVTN